MNDENNEVNAEKFKNNLLLLLDLINEIIDYGKSNGINIDIDNTVFIGSKFFINKSDKIFLIKNFISKSYEYWDSIKNKDEDFLKNNCNILFNELPEKYIDIFKNMFEYKLEDGSLLLDEDVKNNIWELIFALINNSINHIYQIREMSKDPVTLKYTKNYFPIIKIKNEKEKWNIK